MKESYLHPLCGHLKNPTKHGTDGRRGTVEDHRITVLPHFPEDKCRKGVDVLPMSWDR